MGIDIPGQDTQQGGFARSIGSDQRETPLGLKIPVYGNQEIPVTDRVMEVSNLKHNLSLVDKNHTTTVQQSPRSFKGI
jgi:hypothetical protein